MKTMIVRYLQTSTTLLRKMNGCQYGLGTTHFFKVQGTFSCVFKMIYSIYLEAMEE